MSAKDGSDATFATIRLKPLVLLLRDAVSCGKEHPVMLMHKSESYGRNDVLWLHCFEGTQILEATLYTSCKQLQLCPDTPICSF